jgi:ribosome-binding factor A
MTDRSRRTERIADLIRQELGQLLEREVKDPRIGFATITGVEVTGDLRMALVSVSVLGDENQKKQTLEGLTAAQHFLRYQLAHRLGLRYTPVVTFQLDQREEYERRIEELIRRSRS